MALIYHSPGDPSGHRIMKLHANRLSDALGLHFEPVTVGEYAALSRRAYSGAVAYLLFRGGHYYMVARKCGELGIPLYTKIPIQVVARGICRGLEGSGCGRVYLLYRPARRFGRLQSRDINRLVRMVSDLCGARLKPVTSYGELKTPGCVVSATLLPSSSVAFMLEPRLPVVIPFLIYLIGDYMAEHVKEVLKARTGPGGCCPTS